jgi:hypothetical protein
MSSEQWKIKTVGIKTGGFDTDRPQRGGPAVNSSAGGLPPKVIGAIRGYQTQNAGATPCL